MIQNNDEGLPSHLVVLCADQNVFLTFYSFLIIFLCLQKRGYEDSPFRLNRGTGNETSSLMTLRRWSVQAGKQLSTNELVSSVIDCHAGLPIYVKPLMMKPPGNVTADLA